MCMCESVAIACTCSCIHVVGVCTCTNKNVYHTAESFCSTKISPSLATCKCTFTLVWQKILIEANEVKVATGQKITGQKLHPWELGLKMWSFLLEKISSYTICVRMWWMGVDIVYLCPCFSKGHTEKEGHIEIGKKEWICSSWSMYQEYTDVRVSLTNMLKTDSLLLKTY